MDAVSDREALNQGRNEQRSSSPREGQVRHEFPEYDSLRWRARVSLVLRAEGSAHRRSHRLSDREGHERREYDECSRVR